MALWTLISTGTDCIGSGATFLDDRDFGLKTVTHFFINLIPDKIFLEILLFLAIIGSSSSLQLSTVSHSLSDSLLGKNHLSRELMCDMYSGLHPSLPHASNKLLYASPTFPRIELGCVNALLTIWCHCPSDQWENDGARTGSSFRSSLRAVRGLEFNKLSTPTKTVWSSSSVTSASFSTTEMARFADFIMVSNTPPKWGADGGFQC